MIISATAHQNGKGTDRYKSVVGLTDGERTALKAGDSVFFESQYLSGGNHGTYWRRVDYRYRGRHYYCPRVPSNDELAKLTK